MSYGAILVLIVILMGYLFSRSRKSSRLSYIENYKFNAAIGKKVQARYSHLTPQQMQLVYDGLPSGQGGCFDGFGDASGSADGGGGCSGD